MRAVSFNVTVPGYVLGKSLGRISQAFVFGRPSGLRLEERDSLPLPAADWVRVQVRKAGSCGTDVGNLTFKASPAMEPFGSFPAVLGHEILGRVVEVGAAVRSVEVGQRVTVDPVVSCTLRGFTGGRGCRSCLE
ncbi:MAG: alcohol dehydrogenase, partial [Gemmatimonadetes bacterium]|nr:alcohol dehydrogenase [Gemmatimonadota bacterium]